MVRIWEPFAAAEDDQGRPRFTPADGDAFGHRVAGPAPKVLYLVEGRQLGYGTKDAWNR